MFTLISFTSGQVLLATASLALAVVAVIAVLRYAMRHNSRKLTTKQRQVKTTERLRSRTKYPQVDIFRHTSTLTLAGVAAALFLVLAAMSWTSYEQEVYVPEIDMAVETDVIVEPPRTAEPPPPPPPPPPPVIQEVPDELVIEDDDLEFMDQSIDAETVIEIPEPIAETTAVENTPPPPPPPPVVEEEEIFRVVEEMPRFPGCEDTGGSTKERTDCANKKLYEFIYSHIKYPLTARENNIQGSVVLSFVVNRDGSIEGIEILRDPGAGCGEEAKRVIEMINDKGIKWTPGKQRGKPVRVQFILPVKFALA